MVLLTSTTEVLNKGDTAPHFSLKNVDGNTISLNQFKNKIVVIIFMCNHCPYVIPKLDEIAAIQKEYASKDVVVLCINSNDTTLYEEDNYENMQRVAQEKRYPYYLLDETQDIARAYGAVCTPDPFIFDKSHKLAYHGRINNAMNPDDTPTRHDMREALDKLISGKIVEHWFEPSMGCSIKWKH